MTVIAKDFVPNSSENYTRLSVTVQVICAPTEAEAQRVAASRRFMRAARLLGVRGGLLPRQEAEAYPLPDDVRRSAEEASRNAIDGDLSYVRRRLVEVAQDYGTTDVGIVTNCYAFEDRVRSYELVAEALGLAVSR
jgi:alkanesulfonate monooxygenase SsuD/methylene tetrahydromethanopterin reductase-like flavin-dependent oxidoreductase (luciferase family)